MVKHIIDEKYYLLANDNPLIITDTDVLYYNKLIDLFLGGVYGLGMCIKSKKNKDLYDWIFNKNQNLLILIHLNIIYQHEYFGYVMVLKILKNVKIKTVLI